MAEPPTGGPVREQCTRDSKCRAWYEGVLYDNDKLDSVWDYIIIASILWFVAHVFVFERMDLRMVYTP
jgi:hypothetical protein